MTVSRIEHRFVDQVPERPEPGILYVALAFRTTVHLCACGCEGETWLPIRPCRHHLTYDGDSITIHGSIGNWRFPCRSHYWIRRNRIVWADAPAERPPWWRRGVRRTMDAGVRARRWFRCLPALATRSATSR